MSTELLKTEQPCTIHSVVCSYSHVASGVTIGKKYEVIQKTKEGEKEVVLIKNDYGDLKLYSLSHYFS